MRTVGHQTGSLIGRHIDRNRLDVLRHDRSYEGILGRVQEIAKTDGADESAISVDNEGRVDRLRVILRCQLSDRVAASNFSAKVGVMRVHQAAGHILRIVRQGENLVAMFPRDLRLDSPAPPCPEFAQDTGAFVRLGRVDLMNDLIVGQPGELVSLERQGRIHGASGPDATAAFLAQFAPTRGTKNAEAIKWDR